MYNDLFSIGPFTVHTYGLFVAIGIISAFLVTERRGKKMGIDVSRLDSLAIAFVIAGFIGSKLLYTLTRIKDIMADPSLVLSLSDGWVVWGGIIGGLIGGYIYCRTHKMNFWKQVDLIIPSVALAQGFGRIGCFFAGCCYGVETTSVLGVVFPEGSLAPAGIRLLPTQLICSVFDFALFFVLIYLVRKKKNIFKGEVGIWYLAAYSFGRFVIEFFRGDLIRGGINGLSTSQIISLIMGTVCIGLLVYLPKRQKKLQNK